MRRFWFILPLLHVFTACGTSSDSQALPQAVIPLPENEGGIVISAPSEDGLVLIEADADIFPAGDAVIIEVMENNPLASFLMIESQGMYRESCDPTSVPECPDLNEANECQYTNTPELGFSLFVPAELDKTIRFSYMDWEVCEGGHLGDALVTDKGNQIDRGNILLPHQPETQPEAATPSAPQTPVVTNSDGNNTGTQGSDYAGESADAPQIPIDPDLNGRPLADVATASILFQNLLPDGNLLAVIAPPITAPRQNPFTVIAHQERVSGVWIIHNHTYLPFDGGSYRVRLRAATSWAPLLLDVKDTGLGVYITLSVPDLLVWEIPKS